MDFGAEVRSLLSQIPRNRCARTGDVARALGDVRASLAVARLLRAHPEWPGADRVLPDEEFRRTRRHSPVFRDFVGDVPLARLREEQADIAAKVSSRNGFGRLRTVAGVDLSYDRDRGFAAIVVLRVPDLAVVEEVLVSREVDFPYVPTYLAYREWPLIEVAMDRLRRRPSLLLLDGQGRLHPMRCGIACHVGVRLDQPTIGVAKSCLVGCAAGEPAIGRSAPVTYEGEVLGHALRTSASHRPLFVSTGHRVALRTAVRVVRSLCVTHHPEPLRLAHVRATEWKRRQRKKVQEGS